MSGDEGGSVRSNNQSSDHSIEHTKMMTRICIDLIDSRYGHWSEEGNKVIKFKIEISKEIS